MKKRYEIKFSFDSSDEIYELRLNLTPEQAFKWELEGYEINKVTNSFLDDFKNKFINKVGTNIKKFLLSKEFPFKYHYTFLQEKISKFCGKEVSISQIHDHVFHRRNSEDSEQMEAIGGAILYILEKYPDAFLNDILNSEDSKEMKKTYKEFCDYQKYMKDIHRHFETILNFE